VPTNHGDKTTAKHVVVKCRAIALFRLNPRTDTEQNNCEYGCMGERYLICDDARRLFRQVEAYYYEIEHTNMVTRAGNRIKKVSARK